MLRLRPSELTLTPDDVEETFRLIAYRRAHGISSTRHPQLSTQPGRPILRRGPERAVQNSITMIGYDPILNPRPQHAIHATVEEEDEEEDDDKDYAAHGSTLTKRDGRVDSVPSSTQTPHARLRHTLSTSSAASSVPHNTQLPLRLARSHEDLLARSASGTQTPDHTVEPSHRLSEHPTSAPIRTNTSSSQSSLVSPTDTPAELRGGGGRSNKHHVHDGRDAQHIPSSLHQVHTFSSPQNETLHPDPHRVLGEETEIPHLRGYFTGRNWLEYDFRRLSPVPHTEPRRHSRRHQVPARSRSSGSAPSTSLSARQRNASTSSAGDVFGGIAAPEPPFTSREKLDNVQNMYNPYPQPGNSGIPISTRFSSGASSNSLAYSYYELPASRQSSNGQAGQSRHPPSQFDGTYASASSNHGAYYSIPASQIHVADSVSHLPASHPLLNQAAAGQHGVSPLPATPYTRTRDTTRSSIGSFSTTDMYGQYFDATTAAARDLPSPLDQFQGHFRELARGLNTRRAVSDQASNSQTQIDGFELYRSHQSISARLDPSYYVEGDAQPYGWTNHGLPQDLMFHTSTHYSDDISPETIHSPLPMQRSPPETRVNHRSSGNDHDRRVPHELQVPTHESAYARLQNAIQAIQQTSARGHPQSISSRHSMPQTTTFHGVSNHARAQPTHQPTAQGIPPHSHYDGTESSVSPSYMQGFSHFSQAHISPPIIPPRRYRHHHNNNNNNSSEVPTRPYHLAPPSTFLSLSHGSGTTSRRAPLVRATTSAQPHRPRLSTQQMNQENSGEAEEAMMRREREAILGRFGEGQGQGEVMDETPPRVGRVERRMG